MTCGHKTITTGTLLHSCCNGKDSILSVCFLCFLYTHIALEYTGIPALRQLRSRILCVQDKDFFFKLHMSQDGSTQHENFVLPTILQRFASHGLIVTLIQHEHTNLNSADSYGPSMHTSRT